jgi:hypothetical protein
MNVKVYRVQKSGSIITFEFSNGQALSIDAENDDHVKRWRKAFAFATGFAGLEDGEALLSYNGAILRRDLISPLTGDIVIPCSYSLVDEPHPLQAELSAARERIHEREQEIMKLQKTNTELMEEVTAAQKKIVQLSSTLYDVRQDRDNNRPKEFLVRTDDGRWHIGHAGCTLTNEFDYDSGEFAVSGTLILQLGWFDRENRLIAVDAQRPDIEELPA